MLLLSLFATAAAAVWTPQGVVASGSQFQVAKGPDGILHVLGSEYVQVDVSGAVLVQEAKGDERQGSYDMTPAIWVGSDGTVHTVTRHSGSYDSGFALLYRRRTPSGSWEQEDSVGTPVARNYVVSVADLDGVTLLTSSQAGADVWGNHNVWTARGGGVSLLGELSGVWRADATVRSLATSSRFWVASGLTDSGGKAAVMSSPATGDIPAQLQASETAHVSGSGRRGFPDLYADDLGQVHVSYGAAETVWYNRYTADGTKVFASDVQVGSALGSWHLSTGLSAVASLGGGEIVGVVLLRAKSDVLSSADLLWTLSTDGGISWSAPVDLGIDMNCTEGRQTPRLSAVNDTFVLFYEDVSVAGISMAMLDIEGVADTGPVDTGSVDTGSTGDTEVPQDTDDSAGDSALSDSDPAPGTGCSCSSSGGSTLGGLGFALAGLGLLGLLVGRRR